MGSFYFLMIALYMGIGFGLGLLVANLFPRREKIVKIERKKCEYCGSGG